MDDPSLRDYIAVLRRRRRLLALCVVAAVAAALAVSLLMTPTYRAQAELLLQRTADEQLAVGDVRQVRPSADAERELNTETRLIESRPIRDAVADNYEGSLDVGSVRATAEAPDSNSVITVSVTSADPAAAAELVNVYVDTYVEARRERRLDDLLAASAEIQSSIDQLSERIADVSQPLDDIDARVAAASPGSDERTSLESERDGVLRQVLPELAPLQSRESSLRGQLAQLELNQDLAQLGGIEVLDDAAEPSSPVAPNMPMNVAVGALLGLLAGIGLVFVVDRLDDSVRSKEAVEEVTGLSTLGIIPKAVAAKGANGSIPIDLITIEDPSGAASEAYRSLRTSVRFLAIDTEMRTLLVTSATASEGKTVTSANLAITFAQGGERVLLVAADLRRPRLHELFGAPRSPGLATALLGEATPDSTAYAIEEVPGLHLMPPGPTPPNPAELLDSPRMLGMLETLSDHYDRVVIDSPPVLPVTDAQVLARSADAVLLVVAHGETSKRGLTRTVELLDQVDAPSVGTVLNRVPASEGYAGQTYQYDTYRSRSERRRKRERDSRTPKAAHLTGNGAGAGPGTKPVQDAPDPTA